MAHFIAAVHTRADRPVAFALVEQRAGDRRTPHHRYVVQRLHRLEGDDARAHVLDDLAAGAETVGHTTLVVTGGQAAADRFHDAGPSAVPVALAGPGAGGGTDVLTVAPQVLVDTFERVLRDGDVEVPGALDAASGAVDALYRAADLEAVARDDERDDDTTEAMSGDTYAGRPGFATTVEQSGREANVSTGVIGDARRSRATEMLGAVEAVPRGRVADGGDGTPDLGAHEDVALALALAVWYGEYTADDLPVTDQADEV